MMNKSIARWVLILLVLLLAGCSHSEKKEVSGANLQASVPVNAEEQLHKPYVLLVSMDAFRHDYVDRFQPVHIKNFRDSGTSLKSLRPIFPSKTFPNHYAIITGMYAEKHGIVSNGFLNPVLGKVYRLSDPEAVRDARFYGGVPLWVAAHEQMMVTASYYWPGSEAPIGGVHPDYYKNYDGEVANKQRIDEVIKWFSLPEKQRPHFVTLYFSDADDMGHAYGTESKEVKAAVQKLDADFNYLLTQLKGINPQVDVVLVSDHGMNNVDRSKLIFIDEAIDMKGISFYGGGPHALLYFEDKSKVEGVYKKLKNFARHFKVYKREEVPEKYHYSKSPVIGDLVIEAILPYYLVQKSNKNKRKDIEKATHGYDPYTNVSMHGIFYAQGPHICKQVKLETTDNVNVYPFIMKVLGLKVEAPIDGVFEPLQKAYCP